MAKFVDLAGASIRKGNKSGRGRGNVARSVSGVGGLCGSNVLHSVWMGETRSILTLICAHFLSFPGAVCMSFLLVPAIFTIRFATVRLRIRLEVGRNGGDGRLFSAIRFGVASLIIRSEVDRNGGDRC